MVPLSAAAEALRGEAIGQQALAIEILAQAAAELVAGDRRPGLLAGVEACELLSPLCAGDRLEVTAAIEARFGRVLRIAGELRRDGEPIFRARLLVTEE